MAGCGEGAGLTHSFYLVVKELRERGVPSGRLRFGEKSGQEFGKFFERIFLTGGRGGNGGGRGEGGGGGREGGVGGVAGR